MADGFYDPAKLFSGVMPPVVTLVYGDDRAPFDSSAEWSRVAGELKEQEDQKKEDDEKSEKEKDDDLKFFRVDLIASPLSLEAKEDDGEPMRWLFPISDRMIRTDDDPHTRTLLERKMANEVESLYCLYGLDKVVDLGGSLNAAYLDALAAYCPSGISYEKLTRNLREIF